MADPEQITGVDYVATTKELYETREHMQRRISENSSNSPSNSRKNLQDEDEDEFVGLTPLFTKGVFTDVLSDKDLIEF